MSGLADAGASGNKYDLAFACQDLSRELRIRESTSLRPTKPSGWTSSRGRGVVIVSGVFGGPPLAMLPINR